MTSTLTPPPPASAPDAPVSRAPARRGDRSGRFHLGKRSRRFTLVAHVLSSVGWFGVAIMVLFLTVLAQGATDDTFARAAYRIVETSLWVSVPIGAVAGATGVVLGLGTKWGVARHWWVVLKEIAFVPLVVTDFLVVAPSAHDAARGAGAGDLGPVVAHCVILALATIVSIVKPFGRTPHGRRRVPSRG
jgi:hypothetical protein